MAERVQNADDFDGLLNGPQRRQKKAKLLHSAVISKKQYARKVSDAVASKPQMNGRHPCRKTNQYLEAHTQLLDVAVPPKTLEDGQSTESWQNNQHMSIIVNRLKPNLMGRLCWIDGCEARAKKKVSFFTDSRKELCSIKKALKQLLPETPDFAKKHRPQSSLMPDEELVLESANVRAYVARREDERKEFFMERLQLESKFSEEDNNFEEEFLSNAHEEVYDGMPDSDDED